MVVQRTLPAGRSSPFYPATYHLYTGDVCERRTRRHSLLTTGAVPHTGLRRDLPPVGAGHSCCRAVEHTTTPFPTAYIYVSPILWAGTVGRPPRYPYILSVFLVSFSGRLHSTGFRLYIYRQETVYRLNWWKILDVLETLHRDDSGIMWKYARCHLPPDHLLFTWVPSLAPRFANRGPGGCAAIILLYGYGMK